MMWAGYKVRREVELRRHPPSATPAQSDGRVRIHLGCGNVDAPGYYNIDARPGPHVHHVGDVMDLSYLPSNHADLIYACHVFEHARPERHREILWEWARVLKPGGTLRLSVPDFDKLITLYQAESRDVYVVAGPLVGRDEGYGPHRWLFNFEYLAGRLEEAGLHGAREWDPAKVGDHEFEDWASRPIRRGKDGERAYPISLNVEATK